MEFQKGILHLFIKRINLRTEILNKLKVKRDLSSDHSGISLIELISITGFKEKSLKKELNLMFKEGLIKTYEGINGKYIKIKTKTKTNEKNNKI